MEKKPRVFIICPVRDADSVTHRKIAAYVNRLENNGYSVHWPPRDTDQSDPIGTMICTTNLSAIYEANEIHIWYDKNSSGSLYDLGGYSMLHLVLGYKKKIVLINRKEAVKLDKAGKSFLKVILDLEAGK